MCFRVTSDHNEHMPVPASLSLSPSAKCTRDVKRAFRAWIHLTTSVRIPWCKRLITLDSTIGRGIIAFYSRYDALLDLVQLCTTVYTQSYTVRAYNLYRASVAGLKPSVNTYSAISIWRDSSICKEKVRKSCTRARRAILKRKKKEKKYVKAFYQLSQYRSRSDEFF